MPTNAQIEKIESIGCELWVSGTNVLRYVITFPDTKSCWARGSEALDLLDEFNLEDFVDYAPKSVVIQRENARRISKQ